MTKPVKLIKPEDVLFFDIETVPEVNVSVDWNWEGYSKAKVWEEKLCKKMPEGETVTSWYWKMSPLHPEFSKIVCISMGYITKEGKMRFKSYTGDESKLLQEFSKDIEGVTSKELWGHNIIGYDIPYLVKRLLIKGLKIPRKLGYINCKPWDVKVVDTMHLWKMTGSSFTSLDVICNGLGIKSPKELMSGPDVKDVYYGGNDSGEEERLDMIRKYCEADVRATAQVYKKIYPLITY